MNREFILIRFFNKVCGLLALSLLTLTFFPLNAYAEFNPPSPKGYVNDFANIISSESFIKIDKILSELKQKTGAEVAVVTLNSLDGYPIEDVGLSIGRNWGVGQKGKDNGVVIIVAPNERKMRIEVGYGLEGILPDSKAGRIRDEYMLPYFKLGDYNKGITFGSIATARTVASEYGVTLSENYELPAPIQDSQDSENDVAFFIFIVIFLILRFTGVLNGGRYYVGTGGGFGGGGSGFGGFGGGGFGGGGSSGGW